MMEQQRQSRSQPEPRYEPETVKKVFEVATRLQQEHRQTLTAKDLESIGAEVGLDPAYVRQALDQITGNRPARKNQFLEKLVPVWWSIGWILPIIGATICKSLFHENDLGGIFFFIGLGIYIGGGIYISANVEDQKKANQEDTQ